MSRNKVTYGLEKVHIAFIDEEASEQPTWKTPVAIPGAVSFTPSPEGESGVFYADDVAYYVTESNNGYSGDLEMANFPDEILKEMFGWELDNNGMLVEIADGKKKKFALMGEIKGDAKNRRFVYYDVTANRAGSEHKTKNENIEPQTKTLSLSIIPIEIDEKLIVRGEMELSDTNATAYNAFYSAVYKPTFPPGV